MNQLQVKWNKSIRQLTFHASRLMTTKAVAGNKYNGSDARSPAPVIWVYEYIVLWPVD